MSKPKYKTGDRVRLLKDWDHLTKGQTGTVTEEDGAPYVRWDEENQANFSDGTWAIYQDNLELIMNKEDKIKEIEAKQRQLADELAELNKPEPELELIANGTVFKCNETYYTATNKGYLSENARYLGFVDGVTTKDADVWRDAIHEEVGSFREAYIRRAEVKEVVEEILAMQDLDYDTLEECAKECCNWQPTAYITGQLVEKLKSLLS